MAEKQGSQLCIYCGAPVGKVKKGKGEHIVPEAIGGKSTLATVCRNCNNGFSIIDRELCSRSPLSIVASQQIDGHICDVWDVDHESKELLLEARPDWSANSFVQYPQIVFDLQGPQIRGDYEEMLHFGQERFVNVLVKAVRRAFRNYEIGRTGWFHRDEIEPNPAIFGRYRYPPRAYARLSIRQLASALDEEKRIPIVLRYLCTAQKRFALNELDNWSPLRSFRGYGYGIGSRLPATRCFFDRDKVFRALAKISINILSKYCVNTPINLDGDGFQDVIRVVKGDTPVDATLVCSNGFVYADDIAPIKMDDGGHSFRLMHMDGRWCVFSSFFGGRIGAYLQFPGPNHEPWICADVHSPLRSEDRLATPPSGILQPLNHRVEWEDLAKIIPSVRTRNIKSELKIRERH